MKPWVTRMIPPEEIVLFNKIKMIVDLLPEVDLGKNEKGEELILSCHILARAVAKASGLKVQDGSFLILYSDKKISSLDNVDLRCTSTAHSWLVTPTGNIIDVYPVGVVGGPLLVSGYEASSVAKLYVPRSAYVSAGNFSKASFRRSVARVLSRIRTIESMVDGT